MSKMPSRKVTTVSGNDEFVRLDIYEGRLPLGEAGDKLLELALADHNRTRNEVSLLLRSVKEQGVAMLRLNETLSTPWPIRWWRYFLSRMEGRKDG